MDIAALSINMANFELARGASVCMMKKAIEQVELTGEMLAELMKSAEITEAGSIDIKI